MKMILFVIVALSVISFPQTIDIKIPRCVDISLNEIVLHDTISSRTILGVDNIIPYQEKPPFEFKFFNRKSTQILTCTFHPGDYLYSLSEFKVEMNITDRNINIDTALTKITVLEPILDFKTGKGIELGIDSTKLLELLDRPDKISIEPGFDIYLYEIKNPLLFPEEKIIDDYTDFFKYYKAHMYYGKYKFRNGKLVEFAFGFPYP